jgi:hypothetical protein
MSTEYSDRKIREILSKTNGQGKLAEQAIAVLIQRDPGFLQDLVTPYLNGIILHAIERARKPTGLKEPKTTAPLPKKAATPKSAPPVSTNTMDNLMKAWAKGFEQDEPPKPGAKKVSQSHIDVLKSMVKKKT